MPLVQLPIFSEKDDEKKLVNNLNNMRKELEYVLGALDLANLNPNYVVVVEAGANINGYYKKFSDGTMECWNYWSVANSTLTWYTVPIAGNTYYYVFGYWTFPASFIAGDPVTLLASGDIGGAGPETHTLFNIDNTHCQWESGIYGLDTRTINTQQNTWLAKGRWK